ncbi:hypothetical protein E2C01_050827 [Portunus trituberculatus]|uniref:Secreted protein n=1 Tax=Portunus trituberculatus TaxID=210409 RepID=A0A5B7GA05_PORTR|nr:hypothetical protein [Portunus trituberculatus]
MFTLLFVGLMLAGLTFLVELVVHAWNKNKENPTLYPGVIFLRQQFFKLYRLMVPSVHNGEFSELVVVTRLQHSMCPVRSHRSNIEHTCSVIL